MTVEEYQSLAQRNRLEAIVAGHHKHKAEKGEDIPMPSLDQLPDNPPLSSPAAVYHKIRSLNAVRHGLTGQTVVMPWEDRQEYDKFCQAFLADLKPVGFEQTQLDQTIADCQWRLNRATAYESAIFHYEAYLAYQGLHEEEVEVEMCKARVAMSVEKHLLNITLYESRIQRKMMNARKALKELQSEPRPEGAVQPVAAVSAAGAPSPQPSVPAPKALDFVFSDLETFCAPPPPAPLSTAQNHLPNRSTAPRLPRRTRKFDQITPQIQANPNPFHTSHAQTPPSYTPCCVPISNFPSSLLRARPRPNCRNLEVRRIR
jgi:hypothetical protein